MKTTGGSVSNICYADLDFAEVKLRQLQDCGAIAFYAVVNHPEYTDMVTGELRKRHLHLYIEAGIASINLETVKKELEQVQQDASLPALGCMRFERSKIDHWLPYCLHDSQYCRYKALVKPYYDIPLADVRTSDTDRLGYVFAHLPRDKWVSEIERIEMALERGQSWVEYCKENFVPIKQVETVARVWYRLVSMKELEAQKRLADITVKAFESKDELPF